MRGGISSHQPKQNWNSWLSSTSYVLKTLVFPAFTTRKLHCLFFSRGAAVVHKYFREQHTLCQTNFRQYSHHVHCIFSRHDSIFFPIVFNTFHENAQLNEVLKKVRHSFWQKFVSMGSCEISHQIKKKVSRSTTRPHPKIFFPIDREIIKSPTLINKSTYGQ